MALRGGTERVILKRVKTQVEVGRHMYLFLLPEFKF